MGNTYYKRDLVVSGLLGSVFDSFIEYYKNNFMLDKNDSNTKVIKGSYNKTLEFIKEIKQNENSDVLRGLKYITADPNLSDIRFDNIESLNSRNALISSTLNKTFNKPWFEDENLNIIPIFSRISFNINIKNHFESIYEFLDHYLYIKYISKQGGDDLERDLNIGKFVCPIHMDLDLDFIKDSNIKTVLYNKLVDSLKIGKIDFINSRPGFVIPYIIEPMVVIKSINPDAIKGKDNLLNLSNIGIEFEYSFNIPILISVETKELVERITINSTVPKFLNSSRTSIDSLGIDAGSYTINRDLTKIIIFDNNESFYIFDTGIKLEDYEKFFIIINKNDKTNLIDSEIFESTSDKSRIILKNIKKGDIYTVYYLEEK